MPPRRDPKQRFMEKVDTGDGTGCWLWTAAKHVQFGYGMFAFRRGDYSTSHRASWMLFNGDIPDGLCVCHACDVPACVNPAHLFLGTQRDNMRDMWQKGRGNSHGAGASAPRGSHHWKSKVTPEDVRAIREMVANGTTQRAAGKRFNISQGTVMAIVHRHTWKHVA